MTAVRFLLTDGRFRKILLYLSGILMGTLFFGCWEEICNICNKTGMFVIKPEGLSQIRNLSQIIPISGHRPTRHPTLYRLDCMSVASPRLIRIWGTNRGVFNLNVKSDVHL